MIGIELSRSLSTRNLLWISCYFSMKYAFKVAWRKCKCQNDTYIICILHWFQRHIRCCVWHTAQRNSFVFACIFNVPFSKAFCGFMELLSLALSARMCISPLTFLYKTIKYENKSEQLHWTRTEYQFSKAFIFFFWTNDRNAPNKNAVASFVCDCVFSLHHSICCWAAD